MFGNAGARRKGLNSIVDIHFVVELFFYRTFLGAMGILDYTAVADFYREQIILAIKEAERKTGKVFLNEKSLFFVRKNVRSRLRVRTGWNGSFSVVQVHVYVTRELFEAFLLAIKTLGYKTRTEFFREKMRLAIQVAGQRIGFSLLDKSPFLVENLKDAFVN